MDAIPSPTQDLATDRELSGPPQTELGIGLIVVGGLLVVRNLVPWFDSSLFWPLVVVGGGLLLVLTARR